MTALRGLTIATRESALALWQAEFIADRLRALRPGLDVRLLGMTTKGDQWLSAPLSEVGGKGLFIKELERAIEDGRADIAVHSCKDLPARLPEGFRLAATGFRADVRDGLVSPRFGTLAALPDGARVGTSSVRRGAQLLARRPDLQLAPVRGNVGTRLAKLDAGEYDALILACAGLERLGLGDRVTERFEPLHSLPAAGQGALSVECASTAEPALLDLLAELTEADVEDCVRAERAVSAGLAADCSMPLAAYCTLQANELALSALVAAADGTRILRTRVGGPRSRPEALGEQAATDLLAQGAAELLAG